MLQCWVTEQDLAGSPVHNETSPSPTHPAGDSTRSHSITGHKGSNTPIIAYRARSSHPSLPEHEGTAPHLPEMGEPRLHYGERMAWRGCGAGHGSGENCKHFLIQKKKKIKIKIIKKKKQKKKQPK